MTGSEPLRTTHQTFAQGVQPAGVSDRECRTGGEPYGDSRESVEHALRHGYQLHRRVYQLPAQEDGQGLRHQTHTHQAWRWLHPHRQGMKIRTALTLKNTCVTATILLLCMTLIYLLSEHTRYQAFFRDLKNEAITKANLFLAGQVDAATMQSVYFNNQKFINEVGVAVYTTDFTMLYHDAIHNDIVKETQAMVNEILQRREIEFHIGRYQAIGMVYHYGEKDYIVTAAAYDGYGYANLRSLRDTLMVLFIVGLSLFFCCGIRSGTPRAASHPQYCERGRDHHGITYRPTDTCAQRERRVGRIEHCLQRTAQAPGNLLRSPEDVCKQRLPRTAHSAGSAHHRTGCVAAEETHQ